MSTSKANSKYEELVKHELVRLCKERGIKHKSKATKPQLATLLEESDAAKAKPKQGPKPKSERKQRPSTKQMLRDMFASVGAKHSVQEVVAHITAKHAVQPATIGTMIGDLKNKKYAAGPVIVIERKGDEYVRTA